MKIISTYIKNCEPLVSLPRFAIDNKNGLSCFIIKLSSTKIYKIIMIMLNQNS